MQNRKGKKCTIAENEFHVITCVVENPHTYIVVNAMFRINKICISWKSVQRIFKKHKFHPYHIPFQQELLEEDFLCWVTFCEWDYQQIHDRMDVVECLLFGDDTTFHRNGSLNKCSYHHYSTENPHITQEHNQTTWFLNVW